MNSGQPGATLLLQDTPFSFYTLQVPSPKAQTSSSTFNKGLVSTHRLLLNTNVADLPYNGA